MKNFISISIFCLLLISSCTKENTRIDLNDFSLEHRHTYSNNNPGFAPCEATSLTYYIEDCFDEAEVPVIDDDTTQEELEEIEAIKAQNERNKLARDGIVNALNAYDALDQFTFTKTQNPAEADFIFGCVEEPPVEEELACGYGNGTKTDDNGVVTITLNAFSYEACCPGQETITQCQANMIAMHEIGHGLGLGHTDDDSEDHIEGTVDNDSESIFNSLPFFIQQNGDLCDLPCDFSESDLEALEILYTESTSPNPSPTILVPEVICVGQTFLACTSNDEPGIWNGPIVETPSLELPEDCVLLMFEEPGMQSIAVTVEGYDCVINKRITVLDEADCPDPGGTLGDPISIPPIHGFPK